jgi:hypothetical protein
VCDFLDQAMQAEWFEQPGDLAAGFVRKEAPQGLVLHSGDLSRVQLGQKFNVHREIINNVPFGSGYAGLGYFGV